MQAITLFSRVDFSKMDTGISGPILNLEPKRRQPHNWDKSTSWFQFERVSSRVLVGWVTTKILGEASPLNKLPTAGRDKPGYWTCPRLSSVSTTADSILICRWITFQGKFILYPGKLAVGVAIDLVIGWPKRVTQTMHTNVIEMRAGVEPLESCWETLILGYSNTVGR